MHWICSWPAAPTDVYGVSRSGNLGEKETQDQPVWFPDWTSSSRCPPSLSLSLSLFLICYIPRCVLCSNTRRCCFLCDSTLVPPTFFLIRRCLCDTPYRLCSVAVDAKNRVLTTYYQVYIWNKLLGTQRAGRNCVCLDVYKNLAPPNNVPLEPRSDLISWHALCDRLKQRAYEISPHSFAILPQ
jgi:hypothetical protein